MTVAEVRAYMYENNVRGDLSIEDMAEDIGRPQGEWLDTGKDPSHSHPLTAIWYRCSECGDGTNTKTNYCPECGAKMKQ